MWRIIVNKQDFYNTKWDARDWSDGMRISWLRKFSSEELVNANADYYFITTMGSVHFYSDKWYFHNHQFAQKTYQDAFPEVTPPSNNQESNLDDLGPVKRSILGNGLTDKAIKSCANKLFEESKKLAPVNNQVKNPSHYDVVPGVQAKDIIKLVLNSELTEGMTPYQIGCFKDVLKYRLRAGKKDNLQQDIDKAEQYVEMGWPNETN